MNRQYIDFVPVKSEPQRGRSSGAVRKTVVKSTEVSELEVNEIFEERASKAGVTASGTKRKDVTSMAPRAHFVNTEKVAKRPLSKNVYQKKIVVVPEEEKSKGPVKIIDKPKKDSKAGLVVTIIITIILGATAGTVAFLLLPK